MKKLAIVAALLVSACVGASLSRVVIPPAHAQVHQRWEHYCAETTGTMGFRRDLDKEQLNKALSEAGREGWELVSVSVRGSLALYCLKRPAP